jgi:membrane-bound lytic murein transglycosylase A
MQAFARCVLLALFACLLLFATACTLQQNSDARALFTPLPHPGVIILGEREAASLALQLDVRNQGMESWRDMSFAVAQSLAYSSARPETDVAVTSQGITLSYGQLTAALRHLQRILPRLDGNPCLLAKDFIWHRIGPDFGFTGYYEPTLHASRTPNTAYPYPLYGLPPDLHAGVPYHTRQDIDRKGALAGRNLEIAWVDSDIDAFFLHIQGSGRLQFPDGAVSHILYAGKNNRPYTSLGRLMREQAMLDENDVNMRSIRRFLQEHPDKRATLFDANPAYVFFREAAYGPVGAMGYPITPWVSVASDRKTLPYGSLIFSILPLPDATGKPAIPFYGLLLPQDTGGAIKDRRVDLFCGAGGHAEHIAGYLDAKGAVYLLIKK